MLSESNPGKSFKKNYPGELTKLNNPGEGTGENDNYLKIIEEKIKKKNYNLGEHFKRLSKRIEKSNNPRKPVRMIIN